MSDFETVAASELHAATPGPAGLPGAPGQPTDIDQAGKPRSRTADAWHDLRRNWIFWLALAIVTVVVLMAAFPSLFTSTNPRHCVLSEVRIPPGNDGHVFGTDNLGCDVYARTIYGARTSITIGLLATLLATTIAVLVGLIGGYYGGSVDAVLSRTTDIFLAIPLLLAAIVLMKRLTTGSSQPGIWPLILVLGVLGWTTAARVVRSSVITAKQQDYVHAAKMLGAGHGRIMFKHILPNSVAPVLVVMTIALGAFIASEATLSYLGVGLRSPAISWGLSISDSQERFRQASWPLLAPSFFLAATVLAFIMLGDAIRDAFDPKLR